MAKRGEATPGEAKARRGEATPGEAKARRSDARKSAGVARHGAFSAEALRRTALFNQSKADLARVKPGQVCNLLIFNGIKTKKYLATRRGVSYALVG